jgi:hypothetical protein
MLARRERWGLTLRGWLLLGAITTSIAVICFRYAVTFLAVTQPVKCEYLVVEGWIPKYALREAAAYFQQHGLKRILAVGGPVGDAPKPTPDDDTYAYVAASALQKMGFGEFTEMIPHQEWQHERTTSSAMAVRAWFAQRQIKPASLTVVSLGPHGRRTRLLYERVFGNQVAIGIISVRDHEYDPECWWSYSEGLKEVVSEGLAYLHARLQF